MDFALDSNASHSHSYPIKPGVPADSWGSSFMSQGFNSDRSMLLALGCVGFISTAPAAVAAGAADTVPAQVAAQMAAVASVSEVLVTGNRQKQVESPKALRDLQDTPQTITVISNQTIRQQNLLTLRDVLATVPGITFGAGEGGGGFGDSINLRGYAASGDITQDGARDSAQYSRTDPFNIQQIEVFNGANSVFNGSGSVGGTINLVSKTPQAEDLTVISAGIGTDSLYRGTIDSNLRPSDDVAVRFNAMLHRNDVPGRKVEKLERFGIAPSVTFGMAGPTRLTLSWQHQEDDNTPQYGVPYFPQTVGVPAEIARDAYFGYRNVDRQEIGFDQLTAILSHDFSDRLSIRNLSRVQQVDQDLVASQPQGTFCLAATGLQPNGTACRSATAAATATAPAQVAINVPPGFLLPSGRGVARDARNRLYFNQTDLTAKYAQWGLQHTSNLGLALSREIFDLVNGSMLRNADGTDPFDRATATRHQPFISLSDPGQVRGTGAAFGSNLYTGPLNFTRAGANRGELDNVAAYLFHVVNLTDQVELNGGLRYETVTGSNRVRTFHPVTQATLTDVQTSNDETLFSHRVGLVYKPLMQASFYLAYGNARSPSKASVSGACTVDTCNVKPETARNYEAGVKWTLDPGVLLTAALFRNERSNFRVPSNEPGVADQVLDGKSRVDGLALGVSGKLSEELAVFANYTWLDSEAVQSVSSFCRGNLTLPACATAISAAPVEGAELLNTPRHSGSLFTTWTFPSSLQLGYGLTWQGSFVVLNTSAGRRADGSFPRTDSYVSHRLFAGYTVSEGLTLQLNVQNVTDSRALTRVRNNANAWATPLEGRSATLSLYYSF
jgi:catecholate siderophore receptor